MAGLRPVHRVGDNPAFVDLDMMGAAWPAPDDDPYQSRLKARNLAAVWNNYRNIGSRRLIMAGVVESQTDQNMLAVAVGSPVIVCNLAASPAALESRIRGRGRDHGSALEKLIARAADLSCQLIRAGIFGFAVETDDRSIDEIGDEVLQHWNAAETQHVR